jgi:hypothetical protein
MIYYNTHGFKEPPVEHLNIETDLQAGTYWDNRRDQPFSGLAAVYMYFDSQ